MEIGQPGAVPTGTLRRMGNKVPEVTVYFWIIKVLATTVGETAADLLNMNLRLGLTWTTVVMAVLTIAALVWRLPVIVQWEAEIDEHDEPRSPMEESKLA